MPRDTRVAQNLSTRTRARARAHTHTSKMGLMYSTIDSGTASQATPRGRHRKRTHTLTHNLIKKDFIGRLIHSDARLEEFQQRSLIDRDEGDDGYKRARRGAEEAFEGQAIGQRITLIPQP
jgi:hypothetical protein